MIWSGGASSGMFDFPATALERPGCVSEEQWAAVQQKTSAEVASSTVVDIITDLASRSEESLEEALESFKPDFFARCESRLLSLMKSGGLTKEMAMALLVVLG